MVSLFTPTAARWQNEDERNNEVYRKGSLCSPYWQIL
jgi:hypothetical protein